MTIRAKDNPFRTERVHRIGFEPQSTTWPALLGRLEQLGNRAAIVGPYGSGKTTLLGDLESRLRARGFEPRMLFTNRSDGAGMPAR